MLTVFLFAPAEIMSISSDPAGILPLSTRPSYIPAGRGDLCSSEFCEPLWLYHIYPDIVLHLLDLQISCLTAYILRASAIYNKCLSFTQHLIQSFIHSNEVLGLKLRSNILCVGFDIWGTPGEPNHRFPSPRAPVGYVLQACNTLSHGGRHRARWFLSKGLQFPTSPWNYLNKPSTSSSGNQWSPHPIVTTKPAFQGSRLFILLLSASAVPPLTARSSLLPSLWGWGCVTIKLLPISSAHRQVSCGQPFP